LPPRYLERMQQFLDAEFQDFMAAYAEPAVHGLRVNTLKLAPADFAAWAPFPLTPLPWSPASFLVSDEDRPGKHPYHAAGLYYLQDPSAIAVTEVLGPQPGERILDLAAAPGGKTTHIAAHMQNQGLLVANEIKDKRIGHLAMNLERWGAHHTAITNATPEHLAAHFGAFFDAVLVDAPCSGEGLFRKDPASRLAWSEDVVRGCAVRQTAILHSATRLVRPGGRLVYSTCTFAPEEDEAVVAGILDEHPDFELAVPPRWAGFAEGQPNWAAAAAGHPELTQAIRLWPQRLPGEGHFIALLRRRTAAPVASPAAAWRPPRLPRQVEQAYLDFCQTHLHQPPALERLALVGSRLYQIPVGLPEPAHLRHLHPGWWLGTFKTDRFEPAHTLALGLDVKAARRGLALPPESPALLDYLHCASLHLADSQPGWFGPVEPGWALVAVQTPAGQAYPLGWGKCVQMELKNHYPRGLQWL
jgi:NOL1/NOP2/sun family putative RNA methylase